MTAEQGQVSTPTAAPGGAPPAARRHSRRALQPAARRVPGRGRPGRRDRPPRRSRARHGPGGAANAAAGHRTENYNRDFAVGREVSVTRQQTGTVKRLSVAVALRNPDGRPRGLREIQQLEELVKGAVGFDQARGDVVAINSRTFATAEEPSAELVGGQLGVDGRRATSPPWSSPACSSSASASRC